MIYADVTRVPVSGVYSRPGLASCGVVITDSQCNRIHAVDELVMNCSLATMFVLFLLLFFYLSYEGQSTLTLRYTDV